MDKCVKQITSSVEDTHHEVFTAKDKKTNIFDNSTYISEKQDDMTEDESWVTCEEIFES